MPKKLTEVKETDVSEEETTAYSGLVQARDLAKKLFGELATPKVVIEVFDHLINEDGEVDEESLEDFLKAKEISADIFEGMAAPAPSDLIDLYVRMFMDLGEEE